MGPVNGLRMIEGGDQAYIFDLIQKSQNTSVHLKVDEEQWRNAQGSKKQASGYGPHVRNLSRLRHTVHALDQKLELLYQDIKGVFCKTSRQMRFVLSSLHVCYRYAD